MPFKGGSFVLDLVGTASLAGGGLGSVLNPEGKAVIVTECLLYVATPSTGAANVNAGCGATATEDASDLISALAVGGAITGLAYSGLAKGANEELPVWAATEYLNVTGDSTTVGFVGKLLINYKRPV